MLWIFLSLIAGFAVELFLCLKFSSTIQKLIPVFIDLAALMVTAMLFCGDMMSGTYWGFSGETLLMALFTWGVMVLIAMGLAWLVSWAVNYIRERKS